MSIGKTELENQISFTFPLNYHKARIINNAFKKSFNVFEKTGTPKFDVIRRQNVIDFQSYTHKQRKPKPKIHDFYLHYFFNYLIWTFFSKIF